MAMQKAKGGSAVEKLVVTLGGLVMLALMAVAVAMFLQPRPGVAQGVSAGITATVVLSTQTVSSAVTAAASESSFAPGQQVIVQQLSTLYAVTSLSAAVLAEIPAGEVVRLVNAARDGEGITCLRVSSAWGRGWLASTVDGNPAVVVLNDELAAQMTAVNDAGTAEQFYQSGQVSLAQEKYAEAVTALTAALERQPDFVDALYYRGLANVGMLNFEAAAADYDAAVALQPDNMVLYRARGYNRINQADWAGAAQDFEMALALNPAYTGAMVGRGYMELLQQHYDPARTWLAQALEADPMLETAEFLIGAAYESEGNTGEALNAYNRALAINPFFSEAYNQRGTVYLNQRNLDAAYADFTSAIETIDLAAAKLKTLPYSNRAIILLDRGEYAAAVADLETSTRYATDNGNAWYNLGIGYAALKQYDDAIDAYTQALEHNPAEMMYVYYNRGNLYYARDDYDNAVLDFTEAIKLNPAFTGALEWRGNAYDMMGSYDLALADYERLAQMRPDYAMVFFNMGVSYYKQGLLDESLANYLLAIERDTSYAPSHYGAGLVYFDQGQYDPARAEVETTLALNPGYQQALDLLAELDAIAPETD